MKRDPNHPRPQQQRPTWTILDGDWDFALDPEATWSRPADVKFDASIVVPFSPGTVASGIVVDRAPRRCWYRRVVDVPTRSAGTRPILHFGAVDRHAVVWADGQRLAEHVGGYTPFDVDLSEVLNGTAAQLVEVVVRADDAPADMRVPRGKQDWWPEPHIIWYPPTSGIWQSVWMDEEPATHVSDLVWTSDPATMQVHLELTISGAVGVGDQVGVLISHGERLLVDDRIALQEVVDSSAVLRRSFTIGGDGIDDPTLFVWRPRHPVLLEATITVTPCVDAAPSAAGGPEEDAVLSYCAIRSVGVDEGRFLLNDRPYQLRLALDQGYWPESGLTAPSLDALRRDVELVKQLGLNGVRKHQKVEDPRWLALCDELGVLVWEELPSAYAHHHDLAATLAHEWSEVIRRDRSHPCIVAWVPVNESWGVPDVARDPQQQALVAALCSLTVALDPTRPVSANDGWETAGGDIVGIHDYDQDPVSLRARYASIAALDDLFRGFGPGRRRLTTDGSGPAGRAIVLTEFGGTTLSEDGGGLFGYGNLSSTDAFVDRYRELCAAALASPVLSGFCWTQLTDTYQEANGLVRMDRTPKADLAVLHAASHGRRLST